MHRTALALTACLAVSPCARAELVRERWGAADTPSSHPGTLKVMRDGQAPRLVFDLSALQPGARIHRASLYCFTQDDLQPREPAQVFAAETVRDDGTAVPRGRPLRLEPPWYRSFDATEAVRRWVKEPATNLGFVVSRFDGLLAPKSYLEILYDGEPTDAPPQVSNLRALHHDGQTFLVWQELAEFRPPEDSVIWVDKFAEKGNALGEGPGDGHGGFPRRPAITLKTLRALQGLESRSVGRGVALRRVREVPDVRYRVYRHTQRITPANLVQAELLGEASPLCAYDEKMKVISYKGEFLDQQEVQTSVIPTLCVEDGQGLMPGEALYVHTPTQAGKSFYAVTAVRDGTENAAQITTANSLAEPIQEQPGPTRPVFQHVQEDRYVSETTEHWYVFWPAPPLSNRPNKPYHVVVGIPDQFATPGPMIIETFHGGFNLVEVMRVPSRSALTLMVEQQISWFDDLCYNQGLGTLRSFRECKVDYFSERYLLRVIEWAMANWEIDRGRVIGGPLHFGIRHPEIFGKLSFGGYTAAYDFKWSPPSGSLARNLGPRDLATTVDGHSAWDVLDLRWYVTQHPGADIPFLFCTSGTGKDSGHTSEFGWQDDPRGWAALRDARQNFVAFWTAGPPGEMGQKISGMRWDKSIPAFSNCSLDNNPGSGDPTDGDPSGQINGYLLWEYDDLVDTQDRWEMTLYLLDACPEESCTVDLTPRHCRQFRPRPGEKLRWQNTSLADNRVVQSGEVAADRWGLVTIENLVVGKAKNRISLAK